MTSITIISDIPNVTGWTPIIQMQQLLAELTGAELHDVSSAWSHRVHSFIYAIHPRPRTTEDRVAIFITFNGYNARKYVPAAKALGGFARVAIWVVDSFWTEAVQREHKLIDKHFDHIVYMQGFDDDFYIGRYGERALRLDWATDVVGLGGAEPDRKIDVLRVGRQPASWDDDKETERACAARGLSFAGRPAMNEPPEKLGKLLMRQHYRHSKFTVAHSNVAAPASYTHPTKAYITARWTDAIACGVVVAGMPPEGDLDLIDWPEAPLRFSSLDREEGLDMLAHAVAAWTPEIALRNHFEALKKLDWRWRFRKLVDALGVSCPRLDDAIIQLEAQIAAVSEELAKARTSRGFAMDHDRRELS